MTSPLSPQWVDALVTGSAEAPARPGVDATIALCLGTSQRRVLAIRDGRVVGEADGDAQVEIPLTESQLEALVAGRLSLARAYMRGDIKPVGSSGAILVAAEVFEDDRIWQGLRE